MKQFIKDWFVVALLGLLAVGSIAAASWRAYRQYQVEQAILDLSKRK